MKVLLVSPKDPVKPRELSLLMGGENTYTQSLLGKPPRHIKYVHYSQALTSRKLEDTHEMLTYRWLMKTRILPLDAGILTFRLKTKYDLIHAHVYSLKLTDYTGPLVLSDSSSNYLFLKDYLGWSQTRIDFSYRLRRWFDFYYRIYDPTLNLAKAKKLIVWSNSAKKIHERLGCSSRKIAVIPPGIDKLPVKKIIHHGFNILFIGVWFRRKGGDLVMKAFRILKRKYPDLTLTLVGQLPKKVTLGNGIRHYTHLPREKLLKDIYPMADVLVLVPFKGEGYGLVVSEAASIAIPAIVSRVNALPELVNDGQTGFIINPGNLKELLSKLEKMINNRSLVDKMGEAAEKNFKAKFSIEKTNPQLLSVYEEACQGMKPT